MPPESWQRELSQAVRSTHELLQRLNLPAPPESSTPADAGFPVLVPENFLQRMQPGNPRDPLLLQVLPLPNELLANPDFTADPVGDLNARRSPGLLQKYHGRALLVTTSACAIHCRYCFRRDYPYAEDPRRPDDWAPALQTIASDPSIREIILSGGDPLSLGDRRLENLCQQLAEIPHLERLRFHSRWPIVLPSRVTPALLALLESLPLQTVFVVHANHPQEITGDCPAALRKLVKAGIPVLNQTVLLREINDSAEILEELCLKLVNLGVLPYYLHQLDRVAGAAHFEVPESLGLQIEATLRQRLPGYAVPRYVREIPGELSKSPI